MKPGSVRRWVAVAGSWACATGALAAELTLPTDRPLAGFWASSEFPHRGRLEASIKPLADGEYELTFKVTDSPIFSPSGRPYPDTGVYPITLERLDDDGLAFTYRQPYPRVRALFFVPRRLKYKVRLEGEVTTLPGDRWRARVNDHNLTLTLSVRPNVIAGTYDYDGRWAQDAGSFRMVAQPVEKSPPGTGID